MLNIITLIMKTTNLHFLLCARLAGVCVCVYIYIYIYNQIQILESMS